MTNCSSDPVREHRVFLREPIWTRHLKLTPVAWKVFAVGVHGLRRGNSVRGIARLMSPSCCLR